MSQVMEDRPDRDASETSAAVGDPREILRRPSEERRAALRSYEDGIAERMLGTGEALLALVNDLERSAPQTWDDVDAAARAYLNRNPLDVETRTRFRTSLQDSWWTELEIRRIADEAAGDPRGIFAEAFGFEATGQIEIERRFAVLIFHCFSLTDFVSAAGKYDVRQDPDLDPGENFYADADGIALARFDNNGFLDGGVAVVNRCRVDEDLAPAVVDHEVRHLLQYRLVRSENDDRAPAARYRGAATRVRQYFQQEYAVLEADTAREILAFAVEQNAHSWAEIEHILLNERGMYAYDLELRYDVPDPDAAGLDPAKVRDIREKAADRLYRRTKQAVWALQYLIDHVGLDRAKTLAYFEHIPLRQWPKIAERIARKKGSFTFGDEEAPTAMQAAFDRAD
jgi:hypothetical protein